MANNEHPLQNLLENIKINLPELDITIALIEKPTKQFFIRFAEAFVKHFDEKISAITSENYEIKRIEGFDYEVSLFYMFKRIYNKFGYHTLSSIDMYNPVATRTKPILRVGSHILTFINSRLEGAIHIVDDIKAEAQLMEHLRIGKEEQIEESNKIAMEIASEEERQKLLAEKAKVVDVKYEKMLQNKIVKEAKENKEKVKINNLQLECNSLQIEVDNIERENENLEEKIITPEEFNRLKEMKKSLTNELESISSKDVDVENGTALYVQTLDHAEKVKRELKKINITPLEKLINEINVLMGECTVEETDLQDFQQKIEIALVENQEIQKNIEYFMEKLGKSQKSLENMEFKVKTMKKDHKKNLKKLKKEIKLRQTEADKINLMISEKLAYKQEIDEEKKKFLEIFSKMYKTCLDAENVTIEKLSNFLMGFEDVLEGSSK